MRRVLIIGPGGAGKSTLAVRLAGVTGLPVVHLDTLYWRPGWDATPADEWRALVSSLVGEAEWIMDGNYGGTLDLRIPAADTIVYLDWSRVRCIWGVIKRRMRPNVPKPSRAVGCPERLTFEFLRWIWTYPERRRPDVLRRLGEVSGEKNVVVLRSRREVDDFVSGCRTDPGKSEGPLAPGTFKGFEREVVAALLDGHMPASAVESILDEAVRVSLEETGFGYFLTAAHPIIPSERTVCNEPLLTGRAGDLECGFIVYLESGELTLECHTWLDGGLPADFRDQDVRVRRAS